MIDATCPRCGARMETESYAHPLVHCGILFWVVDPTAGEDDRTIISTDGRRAHVYVCTPGGDHADFTNGAICNALRFVSETRIPKDGLESIEQCPEAERPWFAHELKQHFRYAAKAHRALFFSGVNRWSVFVRGSNERDAIRGITARGITTSMRTRWSMDNGDGSLFLTTIESVDGYILPEGGRRSQFDHGMLSARMVAVAGEGLPDDLERAFDEALAFFLPAPRVSLLDANDRVLAERRSQWRVTL